MSKSPSRRTYLIGFGLSLVCTLGAYILVANHLLSKTGLLVAITSLALLQFIVQLICFLHLGRESKPRWNLLAFIFMIGVVVILVAGSLWIMINLSYHHDHVQNRDFRGQEIAPENVNDYIKRDEGISP